MKSPYLPLNCLANLISLGSNVTLLECKVHKYASSNNPCKNASAAHWMACRASAFHLHISPWGTNFNVTSLTTLANGNFAISKSVEDWYFLISLKATVPKQIFKLKFLIV